MSEHSSQPSVRNPLDPEVLARVTGLQFRVKQIVEGFITGLHRSPYHGFSVEFAQHRQYVPGDDIRYIDWKVYGKTDRYFIKEYEEETDMRVALMLDCSASMGFSSHSMTKYEYGSCITATLAHILLAQQDSVGLTLFDNGIRHETAPSTNPGNIRNIIKLIEDAPLVEETRAADALRAMGGLNRRGLVILVSDLFFESDLLEQTVRQMKSRGHAVYIFQILDPQERRFSYNRLTKFKGLEGGGELLLNPRSLRESYQREMEHFIDETRKIALRNRVNWHCLDTSIPLDIALASILARQRTR